MQRKLSGSLGKNVAKDLGISSLDSGPKGCRELTVGSQLHHHIIYSTVHVYIHVSKQLFMPNLVCIPSQT